MASVSKIAQQAVPRMTSKKLRLQLTSFHSLVCLLWLKLR